jgi:CheY-like chemotaxis protein
LASRLPLRVLLADDNPINQKVGLSVLRKLGYRADVAHNGVEVIRALEQKVYDLLFLDVQMPEMDGLEAARQIHERWPEPRKRPVIVAMTGNALLGDREKCLAAGMDDYISKPVRVSELQSAIEIWGPRKSRRSETAFFTRPKTAPVEPMLDERTIEDLRAMPPSDGVGMLEELIGLFLEGAPRELQRINESLTKPEALAFHAHALKSMSLNLGAKQVVQLSQRLEELARAKSVEGAPALVRELQLIYDQTRAELVRLQQHP